MNPQELGIEQCEVKVLLQNNSKSNSGWFDSTGQQLFKKMTSETNTGKQVTHLVPAGPPTGYNVVLLGGHVPGEAPNCRKALAWPPEDPLLPGGSWKRSARNYAVRDGTLHAELKNKKGEWVEATVKVEASLNGSFSNNDGKFAYKGSRAIDQP
eukprot:COSAG02_NODE_2990_length_7607_cov_3.437134_9_plen_154_part_00